MPFIRKSIAGLLFAFAFTHIGFSQSPAPTPDEARASVAANTPALPNNAVASSSVVVVIDSSEEHSGNFGEIRRAASQFVQAMGEDRAVAVVAASEKPALVADFGADSDEVAKKVAEIKPHGTASMQQAVQFAARYASQETDHPVVVAFVRNPDGKAAPTEAPAAATVYVIASPDSNWKVQSEMQQLAVKSGGTAFFPSNGRELGDVVKETAVRVTGEADLNRLSNSSRHALAGYERLVVKDIAMPKMEETSEAAGGEDFLMQRVLVARIQKAQLFPLVVDGTDPRAVKYDSNAPAGKVLELRASILEFRRGSRVQRQTMGFRGGSKMKLRVILVDAANNKPVLSFTKEGSYASGLWGGSQEAVQSRAILNVANAIVDELKKVR
jgi:hypothetical protein